MHCGIVLSGSTEEESSVAFIGDDGVESHSVSTNDEIVELVEEKRPEVIAMNAPPERQDNRFPAPADSDTELDEQTSEMFRGGEEKLIEEGHSMLPQGMRDKAVLERADHLARRIEMSGVGTTMIESNARIASDILGLEGDEQLEEIGVETGEIETVWEYDAIVLALVARLYADNRCVDHGIIVPEDDVSTI